MAVVSSEVDCPFCAIIKSTEPAEVVYETAEALAIFPISPATRGHTMVMTKRHYETFLDIPDPESIGLWLAVVRVGRALRSVLEPHGMNVISSAGAAASQSVMHVHVHLVPRWQGDAVGEIWPQKKHTPEVILEGPADRIRSFLGSTTLDNRNDE